MVTELVTSTASKFLCRLAERTLIILVPTLRGCGSTHTRTPQSPLHPKHPAGAAGVGDSLVVVGVPLTRMRPWAARAIWLTSPHRGARRRPRHRRPATGRLGCAEDQVPRPGIALVCVAHLGDRMPRRPRSALFVATAPRRRARAGDVRRLERARRHPGREAKYTI